MRIHARSMLALAVAAGLMAGCSSNSGLPEGLSIGECGADDLGGGGGQFAPQAGVYINYDPSGLQEFGELSATVKVVQNGRELLNESQAWNTGPTDVYSKLDVGEVSLAFPFDEYAVTCEISDLVWSPQAAS